MRINSLNNQVAFTDRSANAKENFSTDKPQNCEYHNFALPRASQMVSFTANIKNFGLPHKNYSLDGKTILITGATGTLGQAIVHELLTNYNPQKIIIFSRDEHKQFEMQQKNGLNNRLEYIIGDVRNAEAVKKAAKSADVIIHAAAMKHVSACEANPEEAILTNIHGSRNIINAALASGVKRVIAISTDKAANAQNLYGATKLISEKLFIDSNRFALPEQHFSVIRMGNILGSRGSVLPIFQTQKKSGKISITDPQMTRFFISPKQAAKQVLSSIEIMQGAEIFVPKLKNTTILKLAKKAAPDCEIKIIGKQLGEKLHEDLITESEQSKTFELADRYVILPKKNNDIYPTAKELATEFNASSKNPASAFSDEELEKLVSEALNN